MIYSSLPFIIWKTTSETNEKKVKEDIKKPQVSAMQETHLFQKENRSL